jgi:autophagy-related protein 2
LLLHAQAKILPLRLYVDQDALDFFKKFFAFKDPDSPSVPEEGEKKEEIYFRKSSVPNVCVMKIDSGSRTR